MAEKRVAEAREKAWSEARTFLLMTPNQKIVSEWLAAVGAETGHELALGEDGHCTIFFADGLQCLVEVPENSETNAVFVYSPLAPLPVDPLEQNALLRQILEWNMFGIATAGSHLSLDPRSESVMLGFAADIDMLDAGLFKEALGDFLDTAAAIHAKWTSRARPGTIRDLIPALPGLNSLAPCQDTVSETHHPNSSPEPITTGVISNKPDQPLREFTAILATTSPAQAIR
jgi:hypothetical protein